MDGVEVLCHPTKLVWMFLICYMHDSLIFCDVEVEQLRHVRLIPLFLKQCRVFISIREEKPTLFCHCDASTVEGQVLWRLKLVVCQLSIMA